MITGKRWIGLPLVLLILAGCRVGRNYQQPELLLPQQFSTTSFADTSSIADLPWEQLFTDTTLQRLIRNGLTYNHDLLAAIKRIEMAQSQVKQARLSQLPTLNLNVTGQYNRPSDNSLNGLSASSFLGKSHIENYQAFLNLSWEADIWGKIRRQQETTLAQYLQTQEAAKAVQTQLVAGIAQGYYNLLMLDQQLGIARRNLQLNDTFVNVTRFLLDGGMVSNLAVQQAEAQRSTTALLVPQLEEQIALQENNLQLLTGQLPGSITRAGDLSDIPLQTGLSTGIPVAMVSRRPDVRATEMALVAANAQVGVAQASMYPGLTITAGGGLESFKSSNWFNIPGSLFGLAAGTVLQPVFQQRMLRTRFEIAQKEREEAVIRFRQSVLTAATEVSNALVQTDKLQAQHAIASQRADTLQVAVQHAQLLFKSDMANYLEVITAQSNALQAELELVNIRRNQLATVVELYRSLGGGWK